MMAFVICLFVFLAFVVALILIPMYKSYRKTVENAVNHDPEYRTFVYKIAMTEKEIIHELSTKNHLDELRFDFDMEFGKYVVKISADGGQPIKYFYEILTRGDESLLRLTIAQTVVPKYSSVAWKLNPFMIEKLNAEIVPFASGD